MMNILHKIDRFFAWVLFVCVLLYLISGFGMTKGIISTDFASKMHLSWLTYVILIAFTVHTSYAIHIAFKRWRIWNAPVKILLMIFFVVFAGGFIYIDHFYKPRSGDAVSSESTDQTTTSTAVATAATTSESSAIKTFTTAELAKYDGQNGNSTYVAVDGNVYDLTSVFQRGSHFSHLAGTELTNAFYSRHAKSILSKYPIVGKLG